MCNFIFVCLSHLLNSFLAKDINNAQDLFSISPQYTKYTLGAKCILICIFFSVYIIFQTRASAMSSVFMFLLLNKYIYLISLFCYISHDNEVIDREQTIKLAHVQTERYHRHTVQEGGVHNEQVHCPRTYMLHVNL